MKIYNLLHENSFVLGLVRTVLPVEENLVRRTISTPYTQKGGKPGVRSSRIEYCKINPKHNRKNQTYPTSKRETKRKRNEIR